jgi:hypothetical protein
MNSGTEIKQPLDSVTVVSKVTEIKLTEHERTQNRKTEIEGR